MIYIVLEMSQMPLIIPRTYFSLFMAALAQCHNFPQNKQCSFKKTLCYGSEQKCMGKEKGWDWIWRAVIVAVVQKM